MRNDPKGTPGKDQANANTNANAKVACQCPFCESPVEEAYPFCKACGQKIRRCGKCGRPLSVNEKVCPHCRE